MREAVDSIPQVVKTWEKPGGPYWGLEVSEPDGGELNIGAGVLAHGENEAGPDSASTSESSFSATLREIPTAI
jgi:hypothetical protein